MLRQNKILGNMLGADIDFIVRGIDSKTRSVVASRKEAMLRKRQIFYLDTDAAGMYRVYEGRIVKARGLQWLKRLCAWKFSALKPPSLPVTLPGTGSVTPMSVFP